MAIVSVKDLLKAGIHFGHSTARWNPKMEKYIFGKKNKIHIIDLRATVKGLVKSSLFLNKIAARGQKILFVGTKKQAREIIKQGAESCGMPYVSERWLGGTLTNLATIRERVSRLEELEALENDGSINQYSKKVIASLRREKNKIFRNLNGIRNMSATPGAMVIIDPRKEKNALAEANRLKIPVIALTDTDCDPDNVDIVIPGNDDAIRAIAVVMDIMSKYVSEGAATYVEGKVDIIPQRPKRSNDKRGPRTAGPQGDRKPAPKQAAPKAEVPKEAPEKEEAKEEATPETPAEK